MAKQDNEPQTDSRTSSSNRPPVPLDHPIASSDDDLLGWAERAESFAREILSLDTSRGLTAAVVGPWGSGKTSFINLMRPEFEKSDVIMLDFNPWLFNDADDLVTRLLGELATVLGLGADNSARKALRDYANMLSGEIGAVASAASLAWAPRTISQQRETVEEHLWQAGRRIVVVVDDVDRLSVVEVQAIFKCVRLTGAFTNIIYIVAFDRDRTARALADEIRQSENGGRDKHRWGRDYLNKIFQTQLNIPPMAPDSIAQQLRDALEAATSYFSHPDIFEHFVELILTRIVRPLLCNMRDIRRYVLAVAKTRDSLGDSVPFPYLVALEAIRLFLPETYGTLFVAVDGLTTESNADTDTTTTERLLTQVRQVADSYDDSSGPPIVRQFVDILFMGGYRGSPSTEATAAWRNMHVALTPMDRRWILEKYLNWRSPRPVNI